ncbi:carbohydrate porin [Vibrio sp. ER1A]|uniref:carbohydrate porin n=1 Tax=Vibrio sp. ER1A TaxID=1517681 RepID=UPI0004DD184B|nr:carbohydrate porin [Vibrio sp. ER1A]KFA97708.1 hypothetical protein HW45_09925 [Vibrio sp. ER1A]
MKFNILAVSVACATMSFGTMAADIKAGPGTLTLGGNMRIDMNATKQSVDLKTSTTKLKSDKTTLNTNGRLSFTADYIVEQNGYKMKARVNPLLKTDGTVTMDDAYLDLKKTGNTYLGAQLGRFEALDLSPLQIDIFVDDADTASLVDGELFAGHYRGNKYRGRFDGAALLYAGNDLIKFETNVVFVDEKDKNSNVALRPVLTVTPSKSFSISAGLEKGFDDASKDKDELGLATTANVKFGLASLNLSYAYKTSKPLLKGTSTRVDTKLHTFGTNIAAYGFGLGAFYTTANNEVKNGSVGDVNLFTTYAGYEHKDFLVDSLTASTGAYYTSAKADKVSGDVSEYGARVRLQYNF